MGALPKKLYPYEPDYAVPPGYTLEDTIEFQGLTQAELAERTGLSAKTVNRIIQGIDPITQETALKLEQVTGISARTWNLLEADYREQLERLAFRKRLAPYVGWLKELPVKELVARGVLPDVLDKLVLLEYAVKFFGVNSPDEWRKVWTSPAAAYRKSPAFQAHPGAMASWLRLGELEARKVQCKPFDRERLKQALARIRTLTVEPPPTFIPRMVEECREAGVAVVLTRELKGAPVSGAARWLTSQKALIQLSLRGKCNDRFWFTFFHEAGHLLQHGKKEVFIDDEQSDAEPEKAADRFASQTLIPRDREARLRTLRRREEIVAFAAEVGVAPGIVLGRLQREGLLPYNRFNDLKVPLAWDADGNVTTARGSRAA
jgi:addiction module HigA family antidote